MGISKGIGGIAVLLHQGKHRLPERIRTGEIGVGGLALKDISDQQARTDRLDRPMRYQQSPGARIKKPTPKPRDRIGPLTVPGRRVAGAQHHPVGI